MSKLIAIDAGHGGSDPGACAGGAQEKNITLEIAKKLKEELLRQNFKVFMTRETDIYDTPKAKAKKANEAGADIFISIHCNSAQSALAEGTETLCFSLSGEGAALALKVQKSLINSLGLKNRGVKERQELTVLNSTKMTAVLVETAFISNANERVLLLSQGFQKKAAKAICKGVLEYFGKSCEEDFEMIETAKIKINGKIYEAERILKDGTNFVKVRDLEKAGFKVENEGSMAVLTFSQGE